MSDKILSILLDRCNYLLPRIADSKITFATYSLNINLLKSMYPQEYAKFIKEKQ